MERCCPTRRVPADSCSIPYEIDRGHKSRSVVPNRSPKRFNALANDGLGKLALQIHTYSETTGRDCRTERERGGGEGAR